MCGLAGARWWGGAPTSLLPLAAAMAVPLRRRGPGGGGWWADPAAGVLLVHRRLAIRDPSPAGAQPMVSADGRFVLVYNGELYDLGPVRDALAAAGVALRGHSDTEVLLEACALWGVEGGLARLDGQFAFALWDRESRTLTLARDRLGIKPLYWVEDCGLFAFASDLRALEAVPGWSRELDPAALAAQLRWGCVPTPHTLYRRVRVLEPGTLLRVDDAGNVRSTRFFDLRALFERSVARRLPADEDLVLERLEAELERAVRVRLAADVPVGVFLSGGVDSALVAALALRAGAGRLHSFAVGFPEGPDERDAVRESARLLGTLHEDATLGPRELCDLVERLPELIDQPLAVRSLLPALALARLAHRRVRVVLCGEGADELFGGYAGYDIAARLLRLSRTGRRAAACALAVAQGLVRSIPHRFRRVPVAQLAALRRALAAGGDELALYRALYVCEAGTLPLLPPAAEHGPLFASSRLRTTAGDPAERFGYLALSGPLLDRSLVRADRAGMAWGLEVRVPFLDPGLVALAWRIPPQIRHRGGVRAKHLLRRLLARHLPPVAKRPKQGFSSPLPAWLRGPLRDWAEGLLDPAELRAEGLFDPLRLRRLWRLHLEGRGDRSALLWSVLLTRQWLRARAGSRTPAAVGEPSVLLQAPVGEEVPAA